MTAFYLWFNAGLYLLFGIWCALKPQGTSNALGYALPRNSGLSEYLTVYGGLQIGLALFFAWLAYRPELHRTGLVLALALYLPIAVIRWLSVWRLWPVDRMTLGVGALEATMLALALALWFKGR